MSDRWSDVELVRICLEGSADELTDEIFEVLQQRLSDSLLIRETVRESPHAEILLERLELPEPQKPAGPGATQIPFLRAARPECRRRFSGTKGLTCAPVLQRR